MKRKGKVEGVTLIRHLSEQLDYLEIEIDFDRIKAFGYYNDFLQFIGKYVEYDTRKDFVDGIETEVIANLVDQYSVSTVDKQESIKLLTGTASRPTCNFSVDDLGFGDCFVGAVCLLSDYEQGKSLKAKWIDLKLVDKYSKVFMVKIFATGTDGEESIEETLDGLRGCYIRLDITSTKYGYQTREISLVNVPVLAAPEVLIAETILNNTIKNDPQLQNYVSTHNMMDIIRSTIRVDLGYEFVYMAAEILLIEGLENISDIYNTQAMRRAVFATRGYLLPHNTKFSRAVRNVTKLARTELKTDKDLLLMVDPLAEEEATPSRNVYYKVRNLAKDLIDERRGIVEDEENIDISISKLAMLNGVL